MESVVSLKDTEEVKSTVDAPGFIIEQELTDNFLGWLMPEENAAYHIPAHRANCGRETELAYKADRRAFPNDKRIKKQYEHSRLATRDSRLGIDRKLGD